ncbi:hypothetical protein [Primorskyibacter sp. S187A]|uniref:hypothetical protein n=1 Tax=Primorskyibacter sp. S187A TaxID=3415130 RepID=UPI003C7C0E47
MRGLSAILICLAVPVSAGPWDGLYRPAGSPDWNCLDIGMDGGALQFEDDIFKGVETECLLANPVNVREMDAILYNMRCTGEGTTSAERAMVMRTPQGVALIRDGSIARFARCE